MTISINKTFYGFLVVLPFILVCCQCRPSYAKCFTKDIKIDVNIIPWVEYKQVRVIDGDTIEFEMQGIPSHLNPISLRIAHIDTPETSTLHGAKCQAEISKGTLAKTTLIDMVEKAKVIKIRLLKWDCYGGRVDGDITLDGVDVGGYMVQHGLAKLYEGGLKSSWCN